MELVDVIAAILRSDASAFARLSAIEPAAICDLAAFHGVLPLVAHRLAHHDELPVALRAMLHDRAGEAATLDLLREIEIRRLLDAFAAGRIAVLIFKGS